jgi:hypothetical protein
MTDIIGPNQPESQYPRNLLYPAIRQSLQSFQRQAADAVTAFVGVRWREEFKDKVNGAIDQLTPWFTDKRIPCDIGEADQISFESLGIHDDAF